MFHAPRPAGFRAALAFRLGEAALESSGWRAVADVLAAEFGAGASLRLQPDAADAPPATLGSAPRLLPVPGLGTFTLDLPAHERAADVLALPLAEILGLAVRLADGLPLRAAEGEAALDPLPYATILLDREARLLFANAAGEDLLRSRRLFLPARTGARLRSAERRADEVLEGAAARILEGTGAGAHWLLRRPDDRTHLAIRLRPVGPPHARADAARLLLTLRAIGAARHPDAAVGAGPDGMEPA